jgi:hypothetical protein
MTKRKILILTANPSDNGNFPRLNLDKEVSEIKKGLKRSLYRDEFEIISEWAVSPDDFRRALLDHQPQIIHFSGHGSGETGLVLIGDRNQPKLVSSESLARLFRLFSGVECVLMNACYSEVQAEAIRAHVDYVIGMNHAIGDLAAIKFAVGFYDGLGGGRTIRDAFEFGLEAIAAEGIPETNTPKLFPRATVIEKGIEGNSEGNSIILETPEGAVRVDSPFYIPFPQESRCYLAIQAEGALIRVKSPQNMGKSSLAIRILNHAKGQNYRTVTLDFQQTNAKFFQDLDKFMQWFCASVGKQMGVRVKVEEYWDDIFGANDNCTEYFEKYLLGAEESPLVLNLENFDRVFEYPDIEGDFCGMLRGWHEQAKNNRLWGKLRLMIVYSQESYVPKDINQSPFNVGLAIELGEFTPIQVQQLSDLHGLDWTLREVEQLTQLIGGHRFLVRQALYCIASQETTLSKLLQTAATEAGIYQKHLLRHCQYLEKHPELGTAMKKVVLTEQPVRLTTQETFKLDSMGLVKRQNNEVVPLCQMYRDYFRSRLG